MHDKTDRRRACRFGCTPDSRHHGTVLRIFFQRRDRSFERRLQNPPGPRR